MRTPALIAVLWLSACGPASSVCSATFSGNFADSSTGSCPRLDGTVLRFIAAAPTVSSTLTGSIDLGPGLRPSTLTSLTTPNDWSALLTREPGCVYTAGKGAVPPGTFFLTLDAELHGTLELNQTVHALPMADCGRGDLQTVRFEF